MVVYEPALDENEFCNSTIIKDSEEFKKISNVIVSNRMVEELSYVAHKVYKRDFFGSD